MALDGEHDEEITRQREAEIRAVTVGELKEVNSSIVLVEYDPQWPRLFSIEAKRIKDVMGDRALSIEHVGSTSVPGLAAKPIIDIVLVVRDSAKESDYVPQMEAAGYVLGIREPNWFEHRKFKGPTTNINVHVFSAGCSEVVRMIAFRDWLREHEDDRELYASAKRELARKTWKYTQNYADAKTAIVDQILAKFAG